MYVKMSSSFNMSFVNFHLGEESHKSNTKKYDIVCLKWENPWPTGQTINVLNSEATFISFENGTLKKVNWDILSH